MVDRITIRKPDDWHLHVRDGDMLQGRAALHRGKVRPRHHDAQSGAAGRAPRRMRVAYRERIMAALADRARTFKPLMTCYLTDDTDPDDVERGFRTACSPA